jgi:transcriptional regulator with XRE-family HTH domain
MAYQDPAALRRRLQRELRRLRTEKGETQRDVATAMDWSPSKLIRIESGAVSVSTNDLRQLLSHYGVADGAVEELVGINKEGRAKSWADFPVLSAQIRRYYGLESSAAILRQFEPMLVPGLLQNEEYTRAVIKGANWPEFSDPEIDAFVEARAARQLLLDRDPAPELYFILDEAVIRREIGSKAVMRRQLERIEDVASRGHVTVQIIPFDRGAHPGVSGPFTVLEFTDEDPALFLESREVTVTRDDPDAIGSYIDLFQRMERNLATSPDQLGKIFSRIMKELRWGEAA